MANHFSVTAPLMIRRSSGERHVMVERFAHPNGLVYFEPFWLLQDTRRTVHLVEGAISGEGPWKVGNCVVHVRWAGRPSAARDMDVDSGLGCHGTDHCLATDFESWRQYLLENPAEYPPRRLIEAIARRLGVVVGPAVPTRTSPPVRRR